MSTITGTTINHGITLSNSGSYTSPLLIASDGIIAATTDAAAIYAQIASPVVVNRGTVTNSNAGGFGIQLTAGGTVVNSAGANITAYQAIKVTGIPGTVANYGTIMGTNFDRESVYLTAGGRVINAGFMGGVDLFGGGYASVASAGTVTGHGFFLGGFSSGPFNTKVINSGAIIAGNYGFLAAVWDNNGPATIANTGKIVGLGQVGIELDNGGTITNSGTIIGGNGTAIAFGGGTNLLALENGYSLGGTITVAGTSNTLELLGATGAVTVAFNSHGLTNFGTVAFGGPSGNDDILKITDTLNLPGTISGFRVAHDIIDLTQLDPTGVQTPTLNGSDQLVVTNGSQTVLLQLDNGDYSGVAWQAVTDGGGGTNVSAACYCGGTMILTPDGEVAVEDLRIGDLLVTLSGQAKPVRWIGRRAYNGRFVAGNREVLPICIKSDAIMKGVPARDLWVSPEHSLYIDDVLVQAKHLVNGISVVQSGAVDQVEYFHIELDEHDVIYADGAPAETFVDCDNRLMFANGAGYADLYPGDERPRWQFCAPRLEWAAPQLTQIRSWMFSRADALGPTDDLHPNLHLVADGVAVAPCSVNGALYRFELPAGSRAVWLRSRSHIPAESDPLSLDMRRLGVPVARISLSNADLLLEAQHTNPILDDGFYEGEDSHRWTNGMASIPKELLRPFHGPVTVLVQLALGAQARHMEPRTAVAA